MAHNSTKTITTTPTGYAWTPGDRHRYVWDGEGPEATVYRIVPRGDHGLDLIDTGDRVPMTGVDRTATAFMSMVDAWRAGNVATEPAP